MKNLKKLIQMNEKLKDLVKELNIISDEMGQKVTSIEDSLSKIGLGVEGEVIIKKTSGNLYVGYRKVGVKWHICIRDEKHDDWQPFVHAKRSYRIAALEVIPELITILRKNAIKTIPAIRKRLEMLDEAINNLNLED